MLLAGCGGAAGEVVASVQGSAITRGDVVHWTSIKRSELQGSPTTPGVSATQLRERALAFLVTADWLQKEAALQGISVSPAEVQASYERLLSGSTGQAFAATLKRRGMSRTDELLVLRLGALAGKLRARIALAQKSVSPGAIRQRMGTFIAAYRQRWRSRTLCQPGYVIAECRNGPPLPPATGNGA